MVISTDRFSFLFLLCAALLGGCASTKEDVIPNSDKTMLQIYQEHMETNGASHPLPSGLPPVHDGDRDLRGYTRDASNEIEQVFPSLPNPRMILYVFPHLSAEGAPVPGYSTAFPLYESDQYALPGELYRP